MLYQQKQYDFEPPSLSKTFNFRTRRGFEIAKSLLERAAQQGRGVEIVKKIAHHLERAHDMPYAHAKGLKLAQLFDERCGSSQALRKASLSSGILLEDNTLGNEPLKLAVTLN